MSKRDKQIPSSYFDSEDDMRFRRQAQEQRIKSQTPTADRYYRKLQNAPSSDNPKQLSTLDRIAIGVIILLMVFWTLVALALTLSMRDSNAFFGVLTGALGFWGFTWLMYYIGWKFYWIMIALGWLLGTGYTLTIFSLFTQSFTRLF